MPSNAINATLICDMLYQTLKREEDEIGLIGHPKDPFNHFLASVSFAPELAVGYLLRKEALRRGIATESERNRVDVCLFQDGACTAMCEIKGPWVINKATTRLLIEDVRKVLGLRPDLPSTRKYNAWIIVLSKEPGTDLKHWASETTKHLGEIDESAISEPIKINRSGDTAIVWNGHSYEALQVIVFSVRTT